MLLGKKLRTYLSRCLTRRGDYLSWHGPSFRHFYHTLGREPVLLGKNVTPYDSLGRGSNHADITFFPCTMKNGGVFRPDAEIAMTAVTCAPDPLPIDDVKNNRGELRRAKYFDSFSELARYAWFHPCSTLGHHRIESQDYFFNVFKILKNLST